MPLAAAVVGAAVIGGAASISASNKAARTARDTAAANNALQQNILNENKATLAPYVATGAKATQSIQALLGLGGDKAAADAAFDGYKTSTGYTSRFDEGQRAVTAALGGRGLLDSGAAQKALLKYGQSFASGEFGNYLGSLQNQQNVGLNAAGQQTDLGQNYANAVSNNNNMAANIQANSALSNGATINGVLGSALSAYGMSQGLRSSYSPTKTSDAGPFSLRGPTGIYRGSALVPAGGNGHSQRL